MRHHGWHLPYHPLQIVAVAVFSALAFSFYVFFVPFVGSSVLRLHVIAVFSPLVFAVFALYVRCAAIDPADSGIKLAVQRIEATRKSESSAEILLQESVRDGVIVDQSRTDFSESIQLAQAPDRWEKAGKFFSSLCCPVLVLWECFPGTGLLRNVLLGTKSKCDKFIPEEELLYCSLCEAEILKSSKHCRACDKCVEGFDHHCRWLNNCIGRKNYKTFVAVMVSSLLMLIMEWSIGISVLVRCFSDKHEFDKEIAQKLGSSFTRTPFVVVVTVCTFLAMLATLPLTQLLFFHLILIKKGITTYDYIVAIREQEMDEPKFEGHIGVSPSSSATSSVATVVSGGSPFVGLHRAVWCTPPRMFVENQSNMKADVVQYATPLRGAFPSPGTDPRNNGGISSRHSKDGVAAPSKRQIGLSAWKLARLSTKEAERAAVRARERSSILRPVNSANSSVVVTETEDSSFEIIDDGSTGQGGNKVGWRLEVPLSHDLQGLGNGHKNPLFSATHPTDVSSGQYSQQLSEDIEHAIIPLGSEARSPFRSRSLNTLTSFPLSASPTESPEDFGSPDLACSDVQHYTVTSQERSWLYRATSDGYEASGGESADDTSDQGHRLSQAWSKLKLNPSFINRGDLQNATVTWSSGSEDVAISQSHLSRRASSVWEARSDGSRIEANIIRHVKKEWPGTRDKISTSTEGSNNSSPSYFVSPVQGMSPDIQSGFEIDFSNHVLQSRSKEGDPNVYEGPFAGGPAKPMTGKKRLSSPRRLKESLLSYRRGLSSSSRAGGALLLSSP